MLACPPSSAYRFRKFVRRNGGAVATASAALAALLVLVAGLAVSNRMIAAERNEKANALKEKEKALAVATFETERSRKNFLAASVAVREVVTKAAMGGDGWNQLPPPLREKLAAEGLKFYQGLLNEGSTDPSLRYETAVGYRSIALLHRRAGNKARAEEHFHRAIEILRELVANDPADVQYRNQLAWAYVEYAGTLASAGRTAAAEESYRKSADLYVGLLADNPAGAGYTANLGKCLAAWARVSETVPYQDRLDLPARVPVHLARADFLAGAGRAREAVKLCCEAAQWAGKLADGPQGDPAHRYTQGVAEFKAAQLLAQTGQSAEAEQAYRRAIAAFRPIVEATPINLEYRLELGRSHNWLGLLLRAQGRRREAEEEHRRAIGIYDEHVRIAGAGAAHYHRRELAWSRIRLADVLSDAGKTADAETEYRGALALCEKLGDEYPTDGMYGCGAGSAADDSPSCA